MGVGMSQLAVALEGLDGIPWVSSSGVRAMPIHPWGWHDGLQVGLEGEREMA